MSKYILDANVYIDAYDRYYRHEFFPSFWESFSIILGEHVVIPKIVTSETYQSKWFLDWLNDNFSQDTLNHKGYSSEWQEILDFVQNCGLYKDSALIAQNGWAIDTIADPWIIAIAKKHSLVVVSEELRDPNLGKGNLVKAAKVPDVCDRQNVRCLSRNEFFSEIGLSV